MKRAGLGVLAVLILLAAWSRFAARAGGWSVKILWLMRT